MDGLALLVGHLVGDYIVQNDWMASNKVNPLAESLPGKWEADEGGGHFVLTYSKEEHDAWKERNWQAGVGHLSCTVHCLLYTISVWALSFWWMPWWGLVACFFIHWPIDRFRLARWWMMHVSGQKAFATGALAPWSVIVVDNTFHLLTLLAIASLQ